MCIYYMNFLRSNHSFCAVYDISMALTISLKFLCLICFLMNLALVLFFFYLSYEKYEIWIIHVSISCFLSSLIIIISCHSQHVFYQFKWGISWWTAEMEVRLQLYDERPLSGSVPKRVTCTIKETQLNMKGTTITPRYVLHLTTYYFSHFSSFVLEYHLRCVNWWPTLSVSTCFIHESSWDVD